MENMKTISDVLSRIKGNDSIDNFIKKLKLKLPDYTKKQVFILLRNNPNFSSEFIFNLVEFISLKKDGEALPSVYFQKIINDELNFLNSSIEDIEEQFRELLRIERTKTDHENDKLRFIDKKISELSKRTVYLEKKIEKLESLLIENEEVMKDYKNFLDTINEFSEKN